MKEPMERLRSLERVLTHLATVHPGLFADVPPGDMPEPETDEAPVGGGPENPPVPPEPEPEPEPTPEVQS